MLKKLLLGIVALLLLGMAGCASNPEAQSADEEPPLTVEQVLATTLEDEDYGEASRCIDRHRYDRVEVLDDQHLIFLGRGDRVWLNTMKARCIGLRRKAVLQFDGLLGAQICQLDTVQSVDYGLGGGLERVSARCALGEFQPISRQQALMLMEQVPKRQRR